MKQQAAGVLRVVLALRCEMLENVKLMEEVGGISEGGGGLSDELVDIAWLGDQRNPLS